MFVLRTIKAALVGACVFVTISSTTTFAQDFPERAVRIVVPFAPGGSSDLLGRTVAEQLSKQTGKTFIVENKPGGSGLLGTSDVARSPADGYSLIQVTAGTIALTPAMSQNVPFDTKKDLVAINVMASEPNALLINPQIPAKTFEEFLDYVRASKDPVSYGSSGSGTPAHLGMELLNRSADLNMTHVPYRGAAPAVADVVAGHVSAVFPTMASAISQIDAGTVRVLAVTGGKRLAKLPDIPTVDELGLPELNVPIWYGYFAPAGTPEDVQKYLHAEFAKALADPEFVARLEGFGLVPWAANQTLTENEALVDAALAQAAEIVTTTGITVEQQ